MSKVIKIKVIRSAYKVPVGLELQVATACQYNQTPTRAEMVEALQRAVSISDSDANNFFAFHGNWEVVK